jgi:hypothetical protein
MTRQTETPDVEGLVAELTELLAKATAGPWLVHPLMAWVSPDADPDMPICQMRMATDGVSAEPQAAIDAALIAAMKNALPAILSSHEAMRARLEKAESVVRPFAEAEITGWRSARPGIERVPYEVDGLTNEHFRKAASWLQQAKEGEG